MPTKMPNLSVGDTIRRLPGFYHLCHQQKSDDVKTAHHRNTTVLGATLFHRGRFQMCFPLIQIRADGGYYY